MKPPLRYVALATLAALQPWLAPSAHAQCPDYVRGSTGGDYTNADHRMGLVVVESYHFTPEVERLIRGKSGPLGADISYTLEHFPNHHRALTSLAKLALREKTNQPVGTRYSIECFFERAMRYQPADAKVRSIYGGYLLSHGRIDGAMEQLQAAATLQPDDGTAHYNLGLLYVKKKDYTAALASAHRAYALGFPLQGLKKQLTAAGKWRDAQ